MGKRSRRKSNRNEARIHPLYPETMVAETKGYSGSETRYVRNIKPKSERQAAFIEALEESSVILALGPAGTGKTYIAVSKAVEALEAGDVQRIVLCRPALEAGESLGYLPGDIDQKLAPYLRPIYDVLSDRLGGKRLKALMAEDTIEIAPVAYMRGRRLTTPLW